jgi:amino acid adenylation domain-containing protein
MPLALRLKGALDLPALLRSLNAIVGRHEVLRTRIVNREGLPVQIIGDGVDFELPEEDLSGLPAAALEPEVGARIREEVLRPFDLSEGALLRGRLLRVAEREQVLLLTMHHIVSDGWSLDLLFRELGAAYAAFSTGRQPALAGLPIQYADFAAWQREWLSGEGLDAQLGYWRGQLEGLATLDLPTDRPRPPVQTFVGAREAVVLDRARCGQVRSWSKREGVTLFMTMLAAFAVLLHRYSGQDDIVVGSPIANRNRSELEGLIGFFVNMLVMRTQVSGDGGFRALLRQVQATALGAFEHQDLPFEKLVELLQPARDRSRNPLFQVQFALQNAPLAPLALEGLTLELMSGDVLATRFDLECHVWERADDVAVVFVYNPDLFEAATIRRMLGHYRTLLGAVVAEPDRPVDRLPLLSAAEQHQLLAHWNRATAEYASEVSLNALFEAQVARTPAVVALDFEGRQVTYAELNARANQLARYLRQQGVGPEVLVGLYVERSVELLVAILGILKAGGAYVPLDPEYPRQRLAFMLDDCAAPVLLTQDALRGGLPDYRGQVVCLDRDWPVIGRERTDNPDGGAGAENPAYVIYTSGSTGQPKGVVVSHANVTRLFAATQDWYGFNAADTWTLFHSSAFDFSVWEIWGALLHGGRLIVVPYAVSRSPEAFYDLLIEGGVTVLNQTPSAFRQLMLVDEARDTGALGDLRLVIFGGEALDPQTLRSWFERHGDRHPQLVNMYGITETTVHVTYRPLAAAAAGSGASVIGSAIPDLELYILDQHHQPVPIGVPGEMYVGGAGLARGYLNRPELTAERFIAHPFRDVPGARLYRTGDLARYRHDGDIEYLGRVDNQVKLRGFRVELGEIEAVLVQHEAVREAVVVCREHDGSEGPDRRLVAYVVAAGPEAPSVSELRDGARQQLPGYMVPSAFVLLERLPLTANGKVDRGALPAPDREQHAAAAFVAPRSDLERHLAAIWREVLAIDAVGIQDNFFDLGGHSLLATQVVSRIKAQLNVDVSVASLFEHPTVAELADFAAATRWAKESRSGSSGSPMRPGELLQEGEL